MKKLFGIPKELKSYFDSIKNAYATKNQQKFLTFQSANSMVDIEVELGKSTERFTVDLNQYFILELFQENSFLTEDELCRKTECNHAEILPYLEFWQKNGVIRYSNANHTWSLNNKSNSIFWTKIIWDSFTHVFDFDI